MIGISFGGESSPDDVLDDPAGVGGGLAERVDGILRDGLRILGSGAAPSRTVEPDVDTEISIDRPWNVIVWNDPITLMTYVVYVFRRLFGYSEEKATQLMLEVHHQGRSIVTTVDREKAEYFVSRLHGFGLQASMEQTD